jgi:hypothetical protein
MLTSFFNKSNPINYIIVGILIVLGYGAGIISFETEMFTLQLGVKHLLFMGVSIFMMLLLDFIIRKNNLTKQNTYGIFIFSGFLLYFPISLQGHGILIANVFLLLALRRILSLHSEKNTGKKILDASVWITMASFFYFYSLLLFIVIYIILFKRPQNNYRNYFIPLLGFSAIFIIATTYYLLKENSFQWFYSWQTEIAVNFEAYNSFSLLIPTSILLTFILWTGLHRIFSTSTISRKERPKYLLMLYILIITIFISLASPVKTGAELLFIISPLAIITANYIENIKEVLFKELLLWLIAGIPIVLFFIW